MDYGQRDMASGGVDNGNANGELNEGHGQLAFGSWIFGQSDGPLESQVSLFTWHLSGRGRQAPEGRARRVRSEWRFVFEKPRKKEQVLLGS